MPHKSRSLPNLKDYRPSEFMRKRRPGYYSDSTVISDPSFSRESFEYHLETLTSRKQEVEFEHFCRRLAQKELCPNLLPQTGPTGGGDSKVDSETYPSQNQSLQGGMKALVPRQVSTGGHLLLAQRKIGLPRLNLM